MILRKQLIHPHRPHDAGDAVAALPPTGAAPADPARGRSAGGRPAFQAVCSSTEQDPQGTEAQGGGAAADGSPGTASPGAGE